VAKYKSQLKEARASLVLVPVGLEMQPRPGQAFWEVEHPSLALALVCETIAAQMWPRREPGIQPSSIVAPSAKVDPSAHVGPFCVVEEEAEIGPGSELHAHCHIGRQSALGKDCCLFPRVTLYRDTKIGDRARIHSGVTIGADGFGYEFHEGQHRKVPQIGSVEIGSDVEIGANSCIDRGRFGATVIGDGCKIDNQVQIGHNVRLGKHCVLCSQVGIAGSAEIGDFVVFGGRAGASGHISIGSGAQLAGTSAAFGDLVGPGKYGGTPSMPLNAYQRLTVLNRRLPELFRRVKSLEAQILGNGPDEGGKPK